MPRKERKLAVIDNELREALKRCVDASELNHAEIGELIGKSQNRVSTILRGDPPAASVGEIDAIARTVGTTALELMRGISSQDSDYVSGTDDPVNEWELATVTPAPDEDGNYHIGSSSIPSSVDIYERAANTNTDDIEQEKFNETDYA